MQLSYRIHNKICKSFIEKGPRTHTHKTHTHTHSLMHTHSMIAKFFTNLIYKLRCCFNILFEYACKEVNQSTYLESK